MTHCWIIPTVYACILINGFICSKAVEHMPYHKEDVGLSPAKGHGLVLFLYSLQWNLKAVKAVLKQRINKTKFPWKVVSYFSCLG